MRKIILPIIIFSMLACERPLIDEASLEPVQSMSKSVTNVEGVLHFDNLKSVDSTMTMIGKMSEAEYNSWAKEMHFNSMFEKYKNLSLSSLTSDFQSSSVAYFDKETNSYQLNSVNSNYAKITNPTGLVVIGNATYIFSATEVKCVAGVNKAAAQNLLDSKSNEYKIRGIISNKVEDFGKSNSNARTGPWSKDQQGNYVNGVELGSNNPNYLKSRLEARVYYISDPSNPIATIAKMSLEIRGDFYHQGWKDQRKKPQRYDVSWTFQIADGWSMTSYDTYTGSDSESGIMSINRVLYDGNMLDIKNLNIPISAVAYNTSGFEVISKTTFVLTN